MASYKVVEVYTDITDCTLHCRVQFFSFLCRAQSFFLRCMERRSGQKFGRTAQFYPRSTFLDPRLPFLDPRSMFLQPSTFLDLCSSIPDRRSSTLDPCSSNPPRSSIYDRRSSTLDRTLYVPRSIISTSVRSFIAQCTIPL